MGSSLRKEKGVFGNFPSQHGVFFVYGCVCVCQVIDQLLSYSLAGPSIKQEGKTPSLSALEICLPGDDDEATIPTGRNQEADGGVGRRRKKQCHYRHGVRAVINTAALIAIGNADILMQ